MYFLSPVNTTANISQLDVTSPQLKKKKNFPGYIFSVFFFLLKSFSWKGSLVQRQGFDVEYDSKSVARVQQVKSITAASPVLTTSITRPVTEPPLAK